LGDECDIGDCNEGSIIVETQENVECNRYLGANTIGVSQTNGLKGDCMSETLANPSTSLVKVNATYTYSTSRFITSGYSIGFSLGIDSGKRNLRKFLRHLLTPFSFYLQVTWPQLLEMRASMSSSSQRPPPALLPGSAKFAVLSLVLKGSLLAMCKSPQDATA
jgi:hypothetical protein